MSDSTRDQLITAAASLLDSGGQEAVTLRAVAQRVGVSHNAPYRHFRDRAALLAAVAQRDFVWMRGAFAAALSGGPDAAASLRTAAAALIDYAHSHRARYRLLFSDRGLMPEPELSAAAFACFEAFAAIVARAQGEGALPPVETVRLTGLIYAAVHGAIDLELGGRGGGKKGLGSVEATVGLLLELLGRR